MDNSRTDYIPIWLIYAVTVALGLAFSITIFFIVWNNSLHNKNQEFLVDTVAIRETVMQKIYAVEDSIDYLSAMITASPEFDPVIFGEFSGKIIELNDFIRAAAILSAPDAIPDPGFQDLSTLALAESATFNLDVALRELQTERFDRITGNIFQSEKTVILSSSPNGTAGETIWFFRLVSIDSGELLPISSGNGIIALAIDASELLTGSAVTGRISTSVYSESAGLFGRQLLSGNRIQAPDDRWQISSFAEQNNIPLTGYSIRLDFSKPVYWHEIEQGLIYTTLIIGVGVTLLLVALVRTRELQARELRKRNIVIEKKVEEQTKELAVARDKALDASRMKSDFLASMSHEIRTPLNAIIGMSELLSETTLTGEQKKYIDIFRKAGDTLLSLVNDILDLSKIEAHQLVLEEISFDARDTVEESVDIYAVKAAGKHIELIARVLPGTATRRIGDPTRLRQIILNLISNALKFTERGEIIVTVGPDETSDDPDRLHFSVSDTGIGIPADKLEKIFASFTQVDSSTTRKYGGTGLGLTISKSLTQMMDGRIWVESEEGKGSRFSFIVRLPVDDEVTEISGRFNIERDLKGKRILVVDDNSTNRLILRENLTGLGAEVIEAENGRQALDQINSGSEHHTPFDLGLIDCRMPEMDGFELAEAMRGQGIDLAKILMISSADLSKDMEKARQLSLGAYLVKPVKRADLLQIINQKLFNLENEPQNTTANQGVIEPAHKQDGTILLVEDNPDNRLLIKAYLKKTEYRIVEAENGQLAVDLFRDNDFDLVFMDVQMPVMDGHEATRQIRKVEAEKNNGRTPIIALTAHAIKEEIDKCIAAGCDTHIGKPVKKATLLQTIEKYMA